MRPSKVRWRPSNPGRFIVRSLTRALTDRYAQRRLWLPHTAIAARSLPRGCAIALIVVAVANALSATAARISVG